MNIIRPVNGEMYLIHNERWVNIRDSEGNLRLSIKPWFRDVITQRFPVFEELERGNSRQMVEFDTMEEAIAFCKGVASTWR